jgi:hypothetical protein
VAQLVRPMASTSNGTPNAPKRAQICVPRMPRAATMGCMSLSAVLLFSLVAWPADLDKALETAHAEKKHVLVYVLDTV